MDWGWWPTADTGLGWRAYPVVWLVVLAVGVYYVVAFRRGAAAASVRDARSVQRRFLLIAIGLMLLWASLDWPLGALGVGQSLSARAVRYLALTLGAAPLLLLGLPTRADDDDMGARRSFGLLQAIAHPVLAVGVFASVLIVTHLPLVVDELERHEVGSAAISLAWLSSAMLLWVPVIGPFAGLHRLSYLASLGYLFLPFIVPKGPGLFFVLLEDPVYDLYAAAESPWGWTAATEQSVAGFILWIIGSLCVVAAIAILFARWYDEDNRMSAPDSLDVPADPHAVDLLFEVPGGWAALDRLSNIVDEALHTSRRSTQHAGAELGFGYRELRARRGAGPEQVVLELRLAVTDYEHRRLTKHIADEYAAYLARLESSQRTALQERLDVRVVRYGSRVT